MEYWYRSSFDDVNDLKLMDRKALCFCLGARSFSLSFAVTALWSRLECVEDYCIGLEKLGSLAHYVTINISSPNTPGLRDLQKRGQIENLVKSLNKIKNNQENLAAKAVLFKIDPDMDEEQLRDIALMSLALGVDGLIISNSTIDRPTTLISSSKNEIGGLSGKPLFIKSTLVLKKMYSLTNGQIPLIGVGGISNGVECYEKIKAGASLVQLYTALAYQGPMIIKKVKNEILSCLNTDGFKNIKEVWRRLKNIQEYKEFLEEFE